MLEELQGVFQPFRVLSWKHPQVHHQGPQGWGEELPCCSEGLLVVAAYLVLSRIVADDHGGQYVRMLQI